MKTMNLKKAASVMVLASVATVMSAQTPEKLFNDELAGKRVTVREVCAKTQACDGARGMRKDRYGLREIGA